MLIRLAALTIALTIFCAPARAQDANQSFAAFTAELWRDAQAKEMVVKKAIYDVLQDVEEVERIFLIVKQQREY